MLIASKIRKMMKHKFPLKLDFFVVHKLSWFSVFESNDQGWHEPGYLVGRIDHYGKHF